MIDYFQLTPDGSWEVISLLDQYHRLGKIESALFQHLKSRFQFVALGADMNGAWRVPPSLAQDKAAAAAVPEAASLSAVDIPQPSSEQRHPQPSSEQRHPQPSSEQRHPQPSSEQRHPQPSSEQRHPQPSSEQRHPQPSSEQRHPQPSSEQRHPCTGDLLRGRYRLGGILERDGVGTVYEATDLNRLDLSETSRKNAIQIPP